MVFHNHSLGCISHQVSSQTGGSGYVLLHLHLTPSFEYQYTTFIMIQTQFETKIKVLRSDNGREYLTKVVGDFFFYKWYFSTKFLCRHPLTKWPCQMKNHHLLEVARALLFTHKEPKIFWGDALLTATYLINMMPSKTLHFETHVPLFFNNFPQSRIQSSLPIKIFGCTIFIHYKDLNKGKIDPKGKKCIFRLLSHKRGISVMIP